MFFFFITTLSFHLNKDAQKKVRDEILRVLGDDLTPNMEQQKELKYMNMVINENLRLYPPVCSDLRIFNFLNCLIFFMILCYRLHNCLEDFVHKILNIVTM